MANNPLASRSEARFQEIDNLGQIIQEQEITQQKETEIQQQTETLQKAAEIEQQLKDNLAQAQEQLKEPPMLEKDQPKLSSRLTKLPAPNEEETNLLSQLQLSLEQLLAISNKTPYLTSEDREVINQNFLTFPLSQKLALISSGLNEVTEEQKQHLLDFGCNKLKLTEEQAEQLKEVHPDTFKTFPLTGQQKNILNSLAPLTREDKYSEESLSLLKQLNLKPVNQTFLVQEEIIPDPHTQFGKSKSSYLPLKEKFLKGEQRIIRAKAETRQKKLAEKKIKENKLSILRSLWKVANREEEDLSETSISEPSQSTSSRYDDLFANLNEEEAKRMKKKLEREEAQKKLQEQERLRRASKLSEKDRKLKEAEERRQEERELEEKQKKLAAIALEDEEERQLIEKKANDEKARIEAEILEVKRKNEEELKKKENQLKKEQETRAEEIRKMEADKLLLLADFL
ncbi:7506_t:CDS:2, partial [Funneliformis geosporum]